MTCPIPANAMDSIASPLKSAMRCCFSWTKRAWVSKSGDAKCISGLCPGVDFGVCRERGWRVRELQERERRTLKSCIDLKSRMPTSSMSRTLLSYTRTRVRLFGLQCRDSKFK